MNADKAGVRCNARSEKVACAAMHAGEDSACEYARKQGVALAALRAVVHAQKR